MKIFFCSLTKKSKSKIKFSEIGILFSSKIGQPCCKDTDAYWKNKVNSEPRFSEKVIFDKNSTIVIISCRRLIKFSVSFTCRFLCF